MTKSKIAVFTISLILLTTTLMAQEVYGTEEDLPFPIQHGGTGSEKAIPDWVDQNFRWYGEGAIAQSELVNAIKYLIDEEIMVIDTPTASSSYNGERIMQPDYGVEDNTQTKVIVRGWDPGQKEPISSAVNEKGQTQFVVQLNDDVLGPEQNTIWIPMIEGEIIIRFEHGDPKKPIIIGRIYQVESTVNPDILNSDVLNSNSKASELIRELVDTRVATESDWEEVIDQLAITQGYDTTDSVVDELQGIVVLCSTAIDKEIYALQAEISLLQELSDMHIDDATTDTDSTRSTGESTEDMDGVWWGERLSKADQKIKSLQTGLKVLEDMLASAGDDAQLANIDLQNVLQKQQQTLQTMSNVSKMLHDTQMSIIRNMK